MPTNRPVNHASRSPGCRERPDDAAGDDRDRLLDDAGHGPGRARRRGDARGGNDPQRHTSAATPRAKSVLFLFLFGGPSHLDTFDPKPDAPAEYRGEFAPIATAVPGVQICEHLPEIARRMDQLALVRSMTCNPSFGDHRMAVHGLLGGIDELPAGATLAASRRDWPCWCAGVEYTRRRRRRAAGQRGAARRSDRPRHRAAIPGRPPDCWARSSIRFEFATIRPTRNTASTAACKCRPA